MQWSSAAGGLMQHGGRGQRRQPVDQHRHLLHPRRQDGAGDGGELASADPAQRLQRVGKMRAVAGKRIVHRNRLAHHHGRVRPRARTDPVGAGAAEQRRQQRRRHGGVADAEIAEAQKVGAAGHRLHAEGHGGGAAALVQRRFPGDVAGGQVKGEVEDLEAEIVRDADLVDRRAAGRAQFARLGRRRDRTRRDVVAGNAVIAGEDRHQRLAHRRRRPAAPCRQPRGDVLDAAERPIRLARPGKKRLHARLCLPVGRRQPAEKLAKVVEG